MKMRLLNFCLLLLSISFITSSDASAQNLTGIWRGYFITDQSEQYKFEIQIEQSKKNSVSGVSYSYHTTVFYGKATLTGTFNAISKSVVIQEIKTVDVRMSNGSVACIMKCLFEYVKSGNEEFLEGTYTSKYENADKNAGIVKGAGCGGGKVFLRKVPTSDFYVEPFLRDNPTTRKPTTITKPAAKPSITKTIPKTPAKTSYTKPPVKTPVKKPAVVTKQKTDTARKIPPPVIVKANPPKTIIPSLNIPATTRSRENELVQTIIVASREVSIRLYDNGEVDDDTISVYLDNHLELSHKRLSTAPISLTLKLDNTNPEHILVMVAENLGRFPPNTSLMIVQDGNKRYQVRITSTNQKNAMVRFKYQSSN